MQKSEMSSQIKNNSTPVENPEIGASYRVHFNFAEMGYYKHLPEQNGRYVVTYADNDTIKFNGRGMTFRRELVKLYKIN